MKIYANTQKSRLEIVGLDYTRAAWALCILPLSLLNRLIAAGVSVHQIAFAVMEHNFNDADFEALFGSGIGTPAERLERFLTISYLPVDAHDNVIFGSLH